MSIVLVALMAATLLLVRPAHAQTTGEAVVAEARSYTGTSYSSMDCTDFTRAVYGAFGVSLPDDPNAQIGYGTATPAPSAGDLVFFSEDGSGSITHAGIATGYGTIVHSSIFTGTVTETPIEYINGYAGARQVV